MPLTESLVGHQLCLQWGDDKVLFWNVCTKLRQEHERTKSTQICLVEGNPMSRRPVVTEGSPPTEVLSVMAALPDRIFVIAGAQVYWLDFGTRWRPLCCGCLTYSLTRTKPTISPCQRRRASNHVA